MQFILKTPSNIYIRPNIGIIISFSLKSFIFLISKSMSPQIYVAATEKDFCLKLDKLGRVNGVLAHKNLDEVDERDDTAYTAYEGHNDSEDSLLIFAKKEVMDT